MTSYWWSGGAITLSCFAAVATAMSAIITVAAPALARRVERYSAVSRAAWLFRLRLLPAACATVCAFGVALPIFLWFEPRDNSDETFARTLVVAAVAGAVLLVRGACRAAAAWRATGALRREWQARGRRLQTVDAPIPVFAIEESFATVAVVGFARPTLFIAERVLRECTMDEVRAMVLHECAHVTHRDNLKRFLIRACPDALRRGGALDRAWTRAVEEAADARAVGGDPGSALELAQALIHVARLAPGASRLEVASAFYLGGSIESRVRRLVEPADSLPDPSRPLGCVIACTMACLVAGLVVLAAPGIHQFMEAVVRALP
jgi:beta-lactamase regulating signal transducer with metallopeptidase domain